jgi:hypothetical protein
MATANLTTDAQTFAPSGTAILIALVSSDPESVHRTVDNASEAFSRQNVLIAASCAPPDSQLGNVRLVEFTPTAQSPGSWTLTAADFLNAYELAQLHRSRAILLLGPEAQSLEPSALRALAGAVLDDNADLAVPRYTLPARAGLVNSAILYPTSRALFGARPRFPLAVDLGLSPRAAERLATSAQRSTSANQPEGLIWPVSEACVAGYHVAEVEGGTRITPQPNPQDLNSLLGIVAGSFFADIDAKAAYWQRARVAPASTLGRPRIVPAVDPLAADATPMIESFRLAAGNLQEIWSLVLPPQSLFGLKRLAAMPSASFAMPDNLWARIVYDFLLAYRLRTINRGHLLGALTPLYLAWVASHVLQTGSGTDPERHIEAAAAAFEAEKPYLVSRWRWPDRFNP